MNRIFGTEVANSATETVKIKDLAMLCLRE